MRSDIVPGAIFPDYELTDHTAKRRKLADLQVLDPMVLALSRGGYCPKELDSRCEPREESNFDDRVSPGPSP